MTHRLPPHKTQHTQEADINGTGVNRTHIPIKRKAADPQLRPKCYRERQWCLLKNKIKGAELCTSLQTVLGSYSFIRDVF